MQKNLIFILLLAFGLSACDVYETPMMNTREEKWAIPTNPWVIAINGQSNARAKMYHGSAADEERRNILTWSYDRYHQAAADAHTAPGFAGQWGVSLARRLVEHPTHGAPTIVINGAAGGRPLAFFEPHGENYAALRDRIFATGLDLDVYIWSQGERDGRLGTTKEEYYSRWSAIRDAVKSDHPSVRLFVIFRTREDGCGAPNLGPITDAQDQLAADFDDVAIIDTAKFTPWTDNCHFPWKGGYERFAIEGANAIVSNLSGP